MKRNDQERIERELKRVEKRRKISEKRGDREPGSIGTYIRGLKELLQHDGHMIFNTLNDEDVLELLIEMKDDLPEESWDRVIRKAVNSTKVDEKELAVTELRSLLE
ncbi:MAG: hypothetical protein AAF721_19685 [Myxococcota bacterium]